MFVVSPGYDPIDDVYVPVTNLSDLPWFDNTKGEINSEVDNAQELTSVSLYLSMSYLHLVISRYVTNVSV